MSRIQITKGALSGEWLWECPIHREDVYKSAGHHPTWAGVRGQVDLHILTHHPRSEPLSPPPAAVEIPHVGAFVDAHHPYRVWCLPKE